MTSKVKLEENVKKLVVRLRNVEERKQIDTVVQILEDLHSYTFYDAAAEIFSHVNVHLPLLLVLDSYMKVSVIQKVGWSLLCRLIELCPNTLHSLHTPIDLGHEWEVLGVHQQIMKILSIYLTNLSVLTAALKALTSILVSDVINFLVLDDEADIFLLIFDAMKMFADKEDIQIYGCQALYLLLVKVPEEQLTEYVENKDHLIILKVLNKYQDSESVILLALQVLLPLAGPPSNVEVLMSGNVRCYNIIMEAMLKFPNSEKIQEVCCSLFQKLTFGSFFNILVLHEAHEVIIKALTNYSANAKLQSAALTCLALLTETIFLNKDLEAGEEMEEVRGQLYWFEASFKALKLHKKNIDVQEAACWALNNLFMYHPELQEQIGDEQHQYPVHREVMLSMLMHSSSKEVFHAATTALATLFEYNEIIRTILLEKGVHINVLEIMKKHLESPEASESACRLLRTLFNGSSFNLDVMTVAMTRLINAMKKHKKVASVQLEALRAMLQIMYHDSTLSVPSDVAKSEKSASLNLSLKVIKNQCFHEGIHKLILKALNKFIGNPAIQECGLKLIVCLSECLVTFELLSEQGALDTIIHTIQMYPGNQEIQCYGFYILPYLITRKNLCIATMHLLSSHLVSTMQRYKDEVRIQEEGFRTALTLMKLCQGFAKLLEMEDFDTVLFYQISLCLEKRRQQKFQTLCLRCFAEMTLGDELKNSLLVKACTENHMVLVESLLLLGADVNKKTKHSSLIVQVCEKDANAKLVELLLNHGVREQDAREALTVSIMSECNNEIISLLLRKLGLDVANNSICLGGFHMGRIEPAWLHPLFLEKQPIVKQTSTDQEGMQDVGPMLARMVFRYQSKHHGCESSKELSSIEELLDKDYCFSYDGYEDVFSCSDDLDNQGSEEMFPMKKSHSFVSLDIHKENVKLNHVKLEKRQTNSLGAFGDEPVACFRKGLPQTDCPSLALKFPLHTKRTDSTSSLTDKEHIISLDLSANDLESIDLIHKKSILTSHLERLEKIELQQNTLTSIPKSLCETLKSLTYLDLRNNGFKNFPFTVLELNNIAFLDLSRNEIGPCLDLETSTICVTLKHLNLSYNQLNLFPDSIGKVAQRLEELILEGNCITEIHTSISLTELRTLNLNKNKIFSLPSNFLNNCSKLEVFCAMTNQLGMIPDIPSKVTTLKLSHNNFTHIPKEILQLSQFPEKLASL